MTSELRSLYLLNTQYATFDLARANPSAVILTTVVGTQQQEQQQREDGPLSLVARAIFAESPLQLVRPCGRGWHSM
jgi:hypothetical protein